MSYPILDTINAPEDIRALSACELERLADEIRRFLIDNVTRSGGHLASNLGAVELTLAVHRVFDSPRDHIIFDVGHQSYVHKLLTGRREDFDTLRRVGGLSGFTRRAESEHDPFGAGHSSTALSAALGIAEADLHLGREACTVAVIGDGACTGGLFHEALNNCKRDLPLILILNDNRMSISESTGSFSAYLSRSTDSTHNYFEELGFSYFGDIDGHDIAALEHAFQEAKRLKRTTVIHVKTVKGNGYFEAESTPTQYHNLRGELSAHGGFASVINEELMDEARLDSRIVAVTAAMGYGTGLSDFAVQYPDRYFDVGIAEGHAVTFSAGLAAGGLSPYFAVYSTFLQRAYDQLLHDVALQNLPVRLLIDRCGLAASDGVTHHGIFDVAYLSQMPNIEILCPLTYDSARRMLCDMRECDHPTALRYYDICESDRVRKAFYADGSSHRYGLRTDFTPSQHPDSLLVTYGRVTQNVLSAADRLRACGHSVGVVALERLAPYNDLARELAPYLDGVRRILFIEEGVRFGGAGVLLRDALLSIRALDGCRYDVVAIDDPFLTPDTLCDLDEAHGLSAEAIARRFLTVKE